MNAMIFFRNVYKQPLPLKKVMKYCGVQKSKTTREIQIRLLNNLQMAKKILFELQMYKHKGNVKNADI